jgi:AAA+ superfamily predicted ATPase
VDKMESYYNTLQHRHSIDGIKIHVDPVVTDLALTIFENVDAHGEIKDGKKPDEISAYSMRKAIILIDTIKDGNVGGMTRNPDLLINFMEQHMKKLWGLAEELEEIAKPLAEKARDILGPSLSKARSMSKTEFDTGLTYLRDVDPRNITYKEKTGLLTSEERYALNFRNTTLAKIATKLNTTSSGAQDIVQYILQRKHELHQYYTEENSFYVCKVGAGNPFLGEAPGELTVHPGTRPVVNLEEIIGSGFGDVKEFMSHIEQSSKWHSLFLATSPSRTADKSNVLLIGPQGCGKSEILRAVGGDKQSIGIFATGSDFLTCWKGEAEKNPKRLFEAANKLQKESKKHVHILIDEIDTILNKATGREAFGNTNLVTEFQNLMDGIVHYPHLSVWGATNVPENIPMPCLRRFSKVAIVGELDQSDRVRLLKHFASFMPVDDDISDEQWALLAKRCVGATGDVLRKVVDHVWREKIAFFTKNHNEKAQELATWLNDTQEQQFSIAEFTAEQRKSFHSLLKPMARIHAKDLDHSITLALENVAVRNEIKTATETYDKAKAFLASIRSKPAAEAAAE